MKKSILLALLAAFCAWSCDSDEEFASSRELQFSLVSENTQSNSGGRIDQSKTPTKVIVSISDPNGSVVADKRELPLYTFGNTYLTQPITLETSKDGNYTVTEFLVLDSENKVIYVTPKEGSKNAHLVRDPLTIDFAVTKDAITTVSPEVIEVTDSSNPIDYGYGQFGFQIIEHIDIIVSAFLKGNTNFELTTADIKVQGLAGDSSVIWEFSSQLDPKANSISLRKANSYRMTATKEGYKPWQILRTLAEGDKIEILFLNLSGMVVEKIWNKNLGGSAHDHIRKVIVAKDGSTVAVGTSYSKDHDVNVTTGQSDAWITKLNPTGTLEWSKTYGSGFWDEVKSIAEFPDGSGFLIAGESTASTHIATGWLMKLDYHGNVLWEKKTGSIGYSQIAVADTNSFLLSGPVDISNSSIIKIDLQGNELWERNLPENFAAVEIETANDGYLLLFPMAAVKVDRNGTLIWRAVPPNLSPGGYSLDCFASDAAGQQLVAGRVTENEVIGGITLSVMKPFIIKLNSAGQFGSRRSLAISKFQHVLLAATPTAAGNFLFVGSQSNLVTNLSEAWLLEVTADGTEVSRSLMGGISSIPYLGPYFNNVIRVGHDFVIAGNSSDTPGKDMPGLYGKRDAWIMKVKLN